MKTPTALSLTRPEVRKQLEESLIESLRQNLQPITTLTDDPYDLWDYTHLSNLGRHYTHLNLRSIETYAEQRTIAFENSLLDLYFQIPARQRNSTLLQGAISYLNPKLSKIRNANHNMFARWQPWQLTAAQFTNTFFRRITRRDWIRQPPQTDDRSWPDRNAIVRNDPKLLDAATKLGTSDKLSSLNIFDMDQIQKRIAAHMAGKDNSGPMILSLTTIDRFLDL